MNQLPWHEQYDKLIQIMLTQYGGHCNLVFNEATGWYVNIEVFGEPKKSYVTSCCTTRETAIDLALKFVSSF